VLYIISVAEVSGNEMALICSGLISASSDGELTDMERRLADKKIAKTISDKNLFFMFSSSICLVEE